MEKIKFLVSELLSLSALVFSFIVIVISTPLIAILTVGRGIAVSAQKFFGNSN